ncbi:MAG: hypothetical protein EG822_10575 [Deltaproteobacteria bacterium]|nr:hypothetical protein [Deltaproteobacteria bacterium]TLN04047.1 MAG: hypothetical protein FDZ73_04905 [bacterium]
MKTILLCPATLLTLLLFTIPAFGQDFEQRLKNLEEALKLQAEIIREQQQTITTLKEELQQRKPEAVAAVEEQQPVPQGPTLASRVSGLFGGSVLTNPNISLVLDSFGYLSDRNNSELENRGIPGYSANGLEQRIGANLRAAELFLFAPVDPYFNLYASLPISEDGMELEEAYAVTTALPAGLQLKGGKFKSNFSRLDAQHPHVWDFADIALPYRAFFGDEGLGGEKGVQLTYLPPLPFYALFGAEALQGDNDLLFGADARTGLHAFTLYEKNSFETSENSTLYFGPYLLFGKTKNSAIVPDAEFNGHSTLLGIEAVWKWQPSVTRSLTLQGEYLYLFQNGDLTDDVAATVDSLRRRQDGFYFQGVYQWNRWRFGARYDMLALFSDSFKTAGFQQELGATPWRATASLEFNPSDFSRIRLQYTHDRSARDGRDNNEWWLQFIFGIGAHAGHSF